MLKRLGISLVLILIPTQVNAETAIDCLAKNIYFEAKSESFVGQTAVALVVLNRVKDKRYPDSVCAVVYEGPTYESWKTRKIPELSENERVYYPRRDRCQFSWYCDGKADKVKEESAYNISNKNEVESPTQIVSPFKDNMLISVLNMVKVIDVSGHAPATPRL